MNSIENELHGYINGTEAMSGFDSYDSYEGDMSYFDDDSYDNFYDGDNFSYAEGSANVGVSDPYVVQYSVTAATGTTGCVLFGYNDHFNQPSSAGNFGNPTTVTIANLQGGTYGRLIGQTATKNFKIGKWRFQCTNLSQLQQTLVINHVDANGKVYSVPLNLSIMRDAYQQQSDIIDVTRPVTIDANTYLTFSLVSAAPFVISMFPVSVLSGKAELNGGKYMNAARAPRLSGKNVAPVIIQTTQDVRGITKG
jgi:hypothetical protein